MKNIILIWSLFYMSLVQAAPPTSIKGEAGSASFTQNIVLPNNQVTKQAGINSRIETGNSNLLANPSFEHSTIATGWTNTGGGTPASSTTNLQDGAKSVTTTSTGVWTFYQDSTLYATAKSGQDAEASIWVYSATASADLWLCPRVNGASVTASVANGCVQYTNLGSPQKLTVFMLYGSTSTGLEVKGSGAITYILDNAYLGDKRPNVPGITTTSDIAYTPTLNAFGTATGVSFKYNRIGNYLNVSGTFTTGTTAVSIASITLPSGLSIDTTKITTSNTTSGAGQIVGQYSSNNVNNFGSVVTATGTSSALVYFGGPTASSTLITPSNGNALAGTGVAFSVYFRVPITEWAGDNNAFTTNCDDPRQCETVFSANVSATGVVSGENVDWINGNCTTASPSVCSFNSGVFSITPNCVAIIDHRTTTTASDRTLQLGESSSSSVSVYTTTGTNTFSQYGFTIHCQKQGADYTNSKISQQIIQSRGVPSVPGASGAIDTFSVSYGGASISTACSASPCTLYNQIGTAVSTITWASTGNMTANFSKTYAKLNCGYTGIYSAIAQQSTMSCSSCNSLPFQTLNGSGSLVNSAGTIMCQGTY